MFSVPMALVDFLPVVFFLLGAIILQKDLYNKMSKGAYALFCAGTIDVFMAGFLKATYKLLYALNICDFEPLTKMFFPVQALGFTMAGVAVVCMLCRPQGAGRMYATAAPALYSGTMLFVLFMVLGLLGLDGGLMIISKKMNKKGVIVLYVISFIFCLMMGYLSSKSFDKAFMNWIAQGVNTIGQLSFFLGAVMLDKAGLEKFQLEK